jgi:hypothetical protein
VSGFSNKQQKYFISKVSYGVRRVYWKALEAWLAVGFKAPGPLACQVASPS